MRFPILCTIGAIMHGCAMAPAPVRADAWPPGFVPGHTDHSNTPQASAPARPNRGVTIPAGLPPIDSPALRGGPTVDGRPSGLLYDLPVTGDGPITSPTLLASWRGAWDGWHPPGIDGPGIGGNAAGGGGRPDTDGDGKGGSCERAGNRPPHCPRPPQPDVPAIPGPLPLLGVAAMFGWARRMRRRVRK